MSAMKELATTLEEHHIELDDIRIVATRSELDGARYLIIDTQPDAGALRIDLNDGTIWDQDPEADVPDMLDGFTAGANHIVCKRCKSMIETGATVRAHVAAARAHVCEENNQ